MESEVLFGTRERYTSFRFVSRNVRRGAQSSAAFFVLHVRQLIVTYVVGHPDRICKRDVSCRENSFGNTKDAIATDIGEKRAVSRVLRWLSLTYRTCVRFFFTF